MNKRQRILIFNVNWLGDVLFSTAVIRNIRYNYPDSFIACIVPPRCFPVLEDNIHLNEVIIFDEKAARKNILQKLKFISYLRAKRFDKVFFLRRSFSRALIAWLAGIPQRIGYYTAKQGFLLTKSFSAPALESLHRIDYYLNIIKQAGLVIQDRYTEFFLAQEDLKAAKEFLAKNLIKKDDFLAGLNPGGNWLPKRWPKENFAALADELVDELAAKIIITGSQQDLELAEDIQRGMRHPAIIACGKLTIKQFAALTKMLNVFVSADSGPAHIANALRARKIIVLFGPTDPKLTGPYPQDNVIVLRKNPDCRIPCYKVNCPDNLCMKKITVSDVFEAIKK